MAWTDQCKIDACAQVNHLVKKGDMSKRQAIRRMAEQSGIPYGTLRRWYYPESVPKNGNAKQKSQSNVHSEREFKKRKWTNATESLKRIDASLSKINGSSLDSLQEVPVAVLRNFLKQFSRLAQYADAAEQRVNNQAVRAKNRKAA